MYQQLEINGEMEETKEVCLELGSAVIEINRLRNIRDARKLREQLLRVLRTMEACDAAELLAARPLLDSAAPCDKNSRSAWTRENRALLVSMLLHFFLEDKLTALPRDLISSSILCFVDAGQLRVLVLTLVYT